MSPNLARLFLLTLVSALMTFLVSTALAQSTPVAAPLAPANTITVNTTADDLIDNGNCTLREAIEAVNTETTVDACNYSFAPTTTINIPAGTYTLTIPGAGENNNQTGDLDIYSSWTIIIQGAGMNETIINGNGLDRIFDINSLGNTTHIRDLTVTGGSQDSENSGGGIRVLFADVTLDHVAVTNNSSTTPTPGSGGGGGGVYVFNGELTIENSLIADNFAEGIAGGVYVRESNATISHSTIQGNEVGNGSGGGIHNYAPENGTNNLTIRDSQIISNTATRLGGGIANGFQTNGNITLLVERTLIHGNSVPVGDDGLSGLGGGIANAVIIGAASGSSSVTVRDSVISENQATNGGGIGSSPATAVGAVSMSVVVENSAIINNSTGGNGVQTGNAGGIAAFDGNFTMTNSTVSGNVAGGTAGAGAFSGLGGGLLIGSQSLPSNVTLSGNTIVNNSAATGASGVVNANLGGSANVQFKSNLIADNPGANCVNNGGTATSLGYNLDSGTSCTFFDQATDLTDTLPMIGLLTADSGTYVHPLMADSPAIDAGSCTDADDNPIPTDQRGIPRPQGNECDIGAYERVLPTASIDVDSTADDLTDNGNCTLREAIIAANTKAAVDMCPAGGMTTTITLPAGTYTFAIPGNFENEAQTGDLDILSTIIINGADRDTTIIDADGLDRVFDVRDAGHATISHLTITGGDNNGANASGGGARAVDGGTLHLSHVHVTGNTAEGSGGGLTALTGTLTIEHVQITQNMSAVFGGGISNRNGSVTISHSSIVGNEAGDSGGGIANQAAEGDANLTITDSEVLNNVAGNNGGGIGNALNTGRTATILVERVTISDNSAAVGNNGLSGLGGGVTNNVFTGAASGAGIVTIRDSVISDNQATNGGGIGNTPATATGFVAMQVTVENSAITGNTASGNGFQTGNGGGIASLDGGLTVINSTISGNTAAGTFGAGNVSGLGGAMLIGSQVLPNNVTLVANTIANNVAQTGTSGVVNASLGGSANVQFKGNLIAGNVGANCVNNGGTATSLGYNLASDASCTFFDQTTDLTSSDPMLDALTMDGATYVHPLMADSPAIDAGSCTDADDNPIPTDQRGIPRPQGDECDIGAYERVLPEVSITVDSTADDLTDNGNCTLREAIEAANTKAAVDLCPAGGMTTTITVPAGTYTITISGNEENGNQTGDLDILSNVVLIGAGQAETILDANGLDRFLDVYNPGRADISHLTITNGAINETSSGGGLRVFYAHADIHHVALHDNSANTSQFPLGGSGGGLYFFGSTGSLNHAEVSRNTASIIGGGVHIRDSQVVISQTLIQENVAEDGSGGGIVHVASGQDSSLTVVDSQIISNTSTYQGGGVSNAFDTGLSATLLIERTLIHGNSAAMIDDMAAGLGGGVSSNVILGASSGSGSVTIRDSVITANQGTNGGGLGSTPNGATGMVMLEMTVENSFIADNTAVGSGIQTGNGGGILALDGSLTVINSTISGNTAAGTGGVQLLSGIGGGIVVGSQVLPANTTLVANTIVNNTALTGASGLANVSPGSGSVVTVKNTLLADNVGANCVNQGNGTINSLGYNLASDASCASFDQTTDLTSTAPMLGALVMDGATYVHPLMAGSPAIDAGSCTDANDNPIATDQRGVSRPQGAMCDIGAYEFVPGAPVYGVDLTAVQTAITETVGMTVTYALTVTNEANVTDTIAISLTGASWVSASSVSTVTLGAGESELISVTVAIPADAADMEMDSVTVTATSQGDESMSANVVLTTTAVVESTEPPSYTIFLPLIRR